MEAVTPSQKPQRITMLGVECVAVLLSDPLRDPYKTTTWPFPCCYCPAAALIREERGQACCPANPQEVLVPVDIYALARLGEPLPEPAPAGSRSITEEPSHALQPDLPSP